MAALRLEELEDGRTRGLLQQGQVEPAVDALALQLPEHLGDDQQRIRGLPGLGPRLQQEVLPRPRAELAEARVRAVGVGLQQRPFVGVHRGVARGEHRAQPVESAALVAIQRHGPEQRGQLARGRAAREVHLEEAFLRVHEPERARDVEAVRALEHGGAVRVARHRHRRLQPAQARVAVERRHAAMDFPQRDRREQHDQAEDGGEDPQDQACS